MPTYDYECKKCGHQFERMQSIKDDALKKCPKDECPEGTGKGAVQRLIGAGGGLLFKGSGFYITDYRSDSYKKSAKADSSSGGKSADSSGSDSKNSGSKSSGSKSSGGTESGSTTSSSKSSGD